MPTSKLRRIEIAQFRDVEPGTERCFAVGDRHSDTTTLLTLLSVASGLDRRRGLAGALDARDLTTAADFHDFEFGGNLRHHVRGFTFTITRRDGRVVAHDYSPSSSASSGFFTVSPATSPSSSPRAAQRPVRAAARRARRRRFFLAFRDPAPLRQPSRPRAASTARRTHLPWRHAPRGIHGRAAPRDLSPVRGSP
ncbi:hypothetical protein OV079_18640 [Nannocystis pusilla]|uniref:Uncharacterized protein n=1 Tax=Nannocystis pusilla TaxID=889268 RepID=A0A9X3IZ37_9BACT|nr:hypothetical protein [Nannocystis pusilla]MCY1007528.1 hypothetical protein [Nannocystis pusilla]